MTTGETTLALHAASDENSAGSVQLGFGTDSLAEFFDRREELGLELHQPPRKCTAFTLRAIHDIDGAECRSAARFEEKGSFVLSGAPAGA